MLLFLNITIVLTGCKKSICMNISLLYVVCELCFLAVEVKNSFSVLYVDLCFDVWSRANEWASVVSLCLWRHPELFVVFNKLITFAQCILWRYVGRLTVGLWSFLPQLIRACLRLLSVLFMCLLHAMLSQRRWTDVKRVSACRDLSARSVLTVLVTFEVFGAGTVKITVLWGCDIM
jgi:hypothetical protein